MIYLHPGVDFLGDDYQAVYAVHDGFVKAILTTGGDPYWRIAIANENTHLESEGYLYAHLNQNSFTVDVGDYVEAGDILGTLYPWNYYDFTHVHYARVKDNGTTWHGNWWTIDNPHIDTVNLQDTTLPVFENAFNNQIFAFRTLDGNYLNPQNLTEQFDIVVKCYDLANSTWKIGIWDINFEIMKANNPDEILFSQFSFAFDFPLDTYIEGTWDNMILNTVFSRDATCYSVGNYDFRDFFHIITNSNGDNELDENDANYIFDSTQFDDGEYIIRVTARDVSENEQSAEMNVVFNNGISTSDSEIKPFNLQNYPNPFNPTTTISFEIAEAGKTQIEIYNVKGQKIKTLLDETMEIGGHSTIWNGTDSDDKQVASGIYFYKVSVNNTEQIKKMILIK